MCIYIAEHFGKCEVMWWQWHFGWKSAAVDDEEATTEMCCSTCGPRGAYGNFLYMFNGHWLMNCM